MGIFNWSFIVGGQLEGENSVIEAMEDSLQCHVLFSLINSLIIYRIVKLDYPGTRQLLLSSSS